MKGALSPKEKIVSKKILAIALIIVMGVTCAWALVGCNPNGDSEAIDPNKTQLYVAVKDDGIGREWADALDDAFEAEYADWENPETGKVGIQVILTVKNEEFSAQNIKNTLSFSGNDVYFVSSAGSLAGWVNENLTSDYLLEITDIVTEKDTSGTDNGTSILDRMNDNSKKYYNMGTTEDPAYFGLPYWYASKGLVYDKDLFEDKGFYAKSESFPNGIEGYIGIDGINGTEDDSYGPDGTKGTPDDGLPPTWTDFKLLLNTMVAKGVTPFTWTGQHDGYFVSWMNQLWASYEGAEGFSLNITFDGYDDQFGQIDKHNAYQLIGQNGRFAALKVCEYIVNDSRYYTQNSFKTAHSHTNAQLEYIMSAVDGNTPIAFLVEGGWWENEAKGAFAEMEAVYGAEYGYGVRNFGLLPAFKFVSGSADGIDEDGIPDQEESTLNEFVNGSGVSTDCSMAFINKSTKVEEIAKLFLKFAYSSEMNANFTSITGVMRDFDYEMSSEQIDNMTKYSADNYYYCTSSTSKRIISSRNPILANNYSFFSNGWGSFITWHNDNRLVVPQTAFYNKAQNAITAEEYFEGMAYYYTQQKWETSLAQYLEG